jgi:hypothetical protein
MVCDIEVELGGGNRRGMGLAITAMSDEVAILNISSKSMQEYCW